MVIAQDPNLFTSEPPTVPLPPCDLASDEPELESYLHLNQLLLLIKCLDWVWRDRTDYFAAGNLTIYYSAEQVKTKDFRGPDFFVALNTEKRPRKSWTVWAEGGKYPNVIVELLSDSTASTDRNLKKALYQDTFRTPEYFWFSPDTLEFEGYVLVEGQYQPIAPTPQGLRWSSQLSLYLGIHDDQLRYFYPEGVLVPTPEESALASEEDVQQAQQQLEQAQLAAAQAQQQAEESRSETQRLRAQLSKMGVDPDTLP